jgi:hypothetical protein
MKMDGLAEADNQGRTRSGNTWLNHSPPDNGIALSITGGVAGDDWYLRDIVLYFSKVLRRSISHIHPPSGRATPERPSAMHEANLRAILPSGSSSGLKMVTVKPTARPDLMAAPSISESPERLRPPGIR